MWLQLHLTVDKSRATEVERLFERLGASHLADAEQVDPLRQTHLRHVHRTPTPRLVRLPEVVIDHAQGVHHPGPDRGLLLEGLVDGRRAAFQQLVDVDRVHHHRFGRHQFEG